MSSQIHGCVGEFGLKVQVRTGSGACACLCAHELQYVCVSMGVHAGVGVCTHYPLQDRPCQAAGEHWGTLQVIRGGNKVKTS